MIRGRARGLSRGTQLLLGTLAVIVVVVGLGCVAYFTPLMSVRSTDIRDNHAVPTDEILSAARVPDGTPLLQVDTREVANRIAAIPSVESVRVQRSYPSSLTITVVERRPVVRITDGDKVHVLDASGVGYLTYDKTTGVPPEVNRLPEFSTPNPGPADPTTTATLGAVAELPESISKQLIAVSASSPVDIEFTLTGDKTVVWGDSDHGAEKARTLNALLSRQARVYNVSSPDFPAYK
ncbi:cell division protein FtsQ/DivIB [Gordonia rhizosphera]|uniref:Cell division protein FtsQ n=1 Tax=Gordonia rhizosphera NBRC 16068 TaxID=1108045 RepID=K6V306_9ACTN|nr:FtsQ-type POTRA domain-containing protein [Gordonia rhizosphera]GAB90393.1 cell division protein FtsQ [Gordonia rhizosphera NBRC 16068]